MGPPPILAVPDPRRTRIGPALDPSPPSGEQIPVPSPLSFPNPASSSLPPPSALASALAAILAAAAAHQHFHTSIPANLAFTVFWATAETVALYFTFSLVFPTRLAGSKLQELFTLFLFINVATVALTNLVNGGFLGDRVDTAIQDDIANGTREKWDLYKAPQLFFRIVYNCVMFYIFGVTNRRPNQEKTIQKWNTLFLINMVYVALFFNCFLFFPSALWLPLGLLPVIPTVVITIYESKNHRVV